MMRRPAARERDLLPGSCLAGGVGPFLAAYAQRSATARAEVPGWVTRRYGRSDAELLDLFVPVESLVAPVPVVVYLGGGYWEMPRRNSAYLAPGLLEMGVAFAAVDYERPRQLDLFSMVDQATLAVEWLYGQHGTFGLDPARIVVAGSAGGAHLAAMVALRLRGRGVVRGALLLSGLFDLFPLVGTSLNDRLGLGPTTAPALSPACTHLAGFPPAVVAVGEIETPAFHQQSAEFAGLLTAHGASPQSFVVPARHHFDLTFDLADPDSLLGQALRGLLEGGR